MRGEHICGDSAYFSVWGSSPHARGARDNTACTSRVWGIIPACAGSTCLCTCTRAQDWDHPRMRGEHLWYWARQCTSAGSSPHARGALPRAVLSQHVQGIIPACAGSTAVAKLLDGAEGDHPRMRGEHTRASPPTAISSGSSPHARGAQRLRSSRSVDKGIIPACAGSTVKLYAILTDPWDHPRMRGEHSLVSNVCAADQGSSPHARGAHLRSPENERLDGIIPACAGSTYRIKAFLTELGDHPRMRGEHEPH